MLWLEGQEMNGPLETPDIYLVHQGEAAQKFAFRLAEQIRSAGFSVVFHCGGGNFKSQMKKANSSGATYAVIVGDNEANSGVAAVKPLREEGEQVSLVPEALTEWLAERLYGVEAD